PALFTFPNRILFGEGARSSLGAELSRLGIRRPLVVTDPGVVKAGLVEEVVSGIGDAVIDSAVQANPTEDDVLRVLDAYRGRGCEGLIALGGGSPIDAAKAVRLLATHPGRLADYDLTTGGVDRIGPDVAPMIAIPTTAGT